MKRCAECGGVLRGKLWGRRPAGECQGCRERANVRARYARDPGVRAQVKAQNLLWRARNREKLRAEWALRKAVRRGTIKRQPCEVCGKKAHAHHEDYTRRFDVRWLCPLHHARQHVAEGRIRTGAGVPSNA